jgi:class 3 adenylate cyclase
MENFRPSLSLRFQEPLESDFQRDYHEQTAPVSRLMFIAGLLLCCSFGVPDYFLFDESRVKVWVIRYAIVAPPWTALIVLTFLPRFQASMQQLMGMGVFLCGVSVTAILLVSSEDELGNQLYWAGTILVFIGGYVFLNLRFWTATIANLGVLIVFVVGMAGLGDAFAAGASTKRFLAQDFMLAVASFMGAVSCYRLEYSARRNFLLRAALLREQEKSEALLLNILPAEIAGRLKAGEGTIADSHEEVSVLFADVVGFTPLAEGMPPCDVVDLLNAVFSHFDALAEKHGVEKIKTVGDSYMAAAGVPRARPDHAVALARLALEMREFVDRFEFFGHRLQMRIGINSGPLVAGVIGQKRFAYDLWGDAVNTASRMESHGQPGVIQITRRTYELIGAGFVCERRGTIPVKGKGQVEVWFLVHERDAQEPRRSAVTELASDDE